MNKDINYYRNNIDNIDKQILDLILQRELQVINIGKIKKLNNSIIHSPDREEKIINYLYQYHNDNHMNFPIQSLIKMWKEMIEGFTEIQKS